MTIEDFPCTVEVYLDDGRVCYYTVSGPSKAREHVSEIIKGGYRHDESDTLEWYPPHRIRKVKISGPPVGTQYPDKVRAT